MFGQRANFYLVLGSIMLVLMAIRWWWKWVHGEDARTSKRARRTTSQSNHQFFRAVDEVVTRLELRGHQQAASELRAGYGSLNGLTDGWALFLQSIEKVQATSARAFDPEDRRALEALRKAVHTAVCRR